VLQERALDIGVPREIKNSEARVGLVPASVQALTARGHHVFIETGAGAGAGFGDDEYAAAGAAIVPDAQTVFDRATLVVKVKEPQPEECARLRPHHCLFTYLHLAADPVQAAGLISSGATAIAYETVTDHFGRLPLLEPMSEVAGRMSVQVGATCLEKIHGGRGVLLGGVPGVSPARVVILGAGVAGTHALQMAVGAGADCIVFDISLARLRAIDAQYRGAVRTAHSTQARIEEEIAQADLVIGAVLVPGALAPKLVTRALLSKMKPGAVLVDIAIDQGGCFETSRPTTHAAPTYIVDGIVHYCVANMPGAVARTSTLALNNATLPYVLRIADRGWAKALEEDETLRPGLTVSEGRIVHPIVARELSHAA
jgi:alanine dehydrogenase